MNWKLCTFNFFFNSFLRTREMYLLSELDDVSLKTIQFAQNIFIKTISFWLYLLFWCNFNCLQKIYLLEICLYNIRFRFPFHDLNLCIYPLMVQYFPEKSTTVLFQVFKIWFYQQIERNLTAITVFKHISISKDIIIRI